MRGIFRSQRSYFILFGIILLFGLVLVVVLSKEEIFFFVNKHHSTFSDQLFYYTTCLGYGWAFLILSLIAILFKYQHFFVVIYAALFQTIIVQVLKKVIFSNIIRPYKYFQEIGVVDIHLVEGVKVYSNHSFPSGHTATAFCVFTLLLLIIDKKYLGPLFLFMAILVGYSRIYLVQHFFIDVYVGSIIGVLSAFMAYWLVNMKAFYPFHSKEWTNNNLLNRK